jgi:hypothetical protein
VPGWTGETGYTPLEFAYGVFDTAYAARPRRSGRTGRGHRHQLWQQRFGGAAGVVGSRLLIERVPYTIIGVTRPRFLGLEIGRAFDVVLPLATEPQVRGLRSSLDKPNALFLIVMLRLKPVSSG